MSLLSFNHVQHSLLIHPPITLVDRFRMVKNRKGSSSFPSDQYRLPYLINGASKWSSEIDSHADLLAHLRTTTQRGHWNDHLTSYRFGHGTFLFQPVYRIESDCIYLIVIVRFTIIRIFRGSIKPFLNGCSILFIVSPNVTRHYCLAKIFLQLPQFPSLSFPHPPPSQHLSYRFSYSMQPAVSLSLRPHPPIEPSRSTSRPPAVDSRNEHGERLRYQDRYSIRGYRNLINGKKWLGMTSMVSLMRRALRIDPANVS